MQQSQERKAPIPQPRPEAGPLQETRTGRT
jgi:hypothetical protein